MARAKGRSQAKRGKAPAAPQSTTLNVLKRHQLRIPTIAYNPGRGTASAGGIITEPGPTGLIVSPTSVNEKTPGATVGIVSVNGPPVNYAFSVVDELDATQWTVLSNVLKLQDGQQVFYADAAQRTLDITATAPNLQFVTVSVVIDVIQAIPPPPPPLAPTNITLSATGIQGGSAGYVIGTVTASDPNLPTNTITFTVVNDNRFTIVPIDNFTGTLRLVPGQVINNPPNATVSITVRATNGFGLFLDKVFVLVVTGNVTNRAHSIAFNSSFA